MNQPEAAGTHLHPTSAGVPSGEGLIRNSLKNHSRLMDEVSKHLSHGWSQAGLGCNKQRVGRKQTESHNSRIFLLKTSNKMEFCSPWPWPGSHVATCTVQIHSWPTKPKTFHLGSPSSPFWPLTHLILLVGPSFSHHISANDLTGVLLSTESH